MKKLFSFITLFFQVFVTYVVLLLFYMVYAIADLDEISMANGIAFVLFQPALALLVTSATVVGCLVIGLPLRLIQSLRKWWYEKPAISLIGVVLGIVLMILAFIPAWMEAKQVVVDDVVTNKKIPNVSLTVSGWLLTAFCLLHFYPGSVLKALRGKITAR